MRISGINFSSYINSFRNVRTNEIKKSPYHTSALTFGKNEDTFTRNPLNKFKDFSVEEYKNLSKEEIAQINKEIDDIGYRKYDSDVATHNIISDNIKSYLDNKYGEKNYTVITIGRSVSSVGKCLGYKIGEETVKIIPMSKAGRFCLTNDIDKTEDIDKFNEYLNSVGLSKKDIENSDKNFIILDYCNTGASLFGATKFLQSDKVWDNQPNVFSENVMNMIEDLDKEQLNSKGAKLENNFKLSTEIIFWNGLFKKYSLVKKCTDVGKTAECVLDLNNEPTYKKQFLFKLLDSAMQNK